MRKIISISIISTMLLTSFISAQCEDNITVTLNGSTLEFDVPPQIIEGRTMVPMRTIFEALGADVEWYNETQTIEASKDGKLIQMTIGSSDFKVTDGDYSNTIELDVPPMITDSRTLVPIRAVSEGFDCTVDWDDENKTVIITSSPQTADTDKTESGDTDSNDTNSDDTQQENTETEQISINYDRAAEKNVGYMKDFKILGITQTQSGDYEINYSLKTFLEGKGDVTVDFRCLDEDGNIVDKWTAIFRGTDYTWSDQEDTVIISGKTTKIEFVAK